MVIIFLAKLADGEKILLSDWSGLVLIYKRQEVGKFSWPVIRDEVMRLTKAQFEAPFECLTRC